MKISRTSYHLANKVIILLIWSIICFLWSCEDSVHKDLQQKFDTETLQMVNHFHSLQKNDTLNFANVMPIPWDTVYVFWGYSSLNYVLNEYPRVNWGKSIEEGIWKHTRRFIFTNNGQAVSYLDIKNPVFEGVHFHQYYRYPGADKELSYNLYVGHVDELGKIHSHGGICFSRAEARFILVGGVNIVKPDLPNRGVNFFKYVPLAYFQARYTTKDTVIQNCILNLHPLDGCGLTNCLANQPKLNHNW